MEGGSVGHNFERDTPRDHLCQVWTWHRWFLPNLAPCGQAVSEEKIFLTFAPLVSLVNISKAKLFIVDLKTPWLVYTNSYSINGLEMDTWINDRVISHLFNRPMSVDYHFTQGYLYWLVNVLFVMKLSSIFLRHSNIYQLWEQYTQLRCPSVELYVRELNTLTNRTTALDVFTRCKKVALKYEPWHDPRTGCCQVWMYNSKNK
jgi:hypothetical protein